MGPQVSYACQRCLLTLQNAPLASRWASCYAQLKTGARTISTTSQHVSRLSNTTQSNATQSRLRLSQHTLGRRAVSFMGRQTEITKNAPPGYQSSPAAKPTLEDESRVLLKPNNLFHPLSKSPAPDLRKRAAFIKQNAYCSHPDHHQTRLPTNPDDPETRKDAMGAMPAKHVDFECPDCGVPVACSEEHWADDYEAHLEICDTLRQINEDDHDLRSGRFFPEFDGPGPQMEEAMVNLVNWDTFLYTRSFEAINDERSLRQATKLLTYPATIGSILHEMSPYDIKKGGRLTVEGLKSLSALRYTLHPPRTGGSGTIKGLRLKAPPMRIFILGARAESSLPRETWAQLSHMFPRVDFHLVFIGPESMANRDGEWPLPERTPANPFGAIVEDRLPGAFKISTFVEYYHTLHKAGTFYPYDPYFDCFMLFHPGLGHPASSHEWEETVPLLLETKVPILVTGYTQYDMQRDYEWVNKTMGGEVDLLLEPGENRFRSMRWDMNDLDPQDISCANWGVWAFRGKRYETTNKEAEAA